MSDEREDCPAEHLTFSVDDGTFAGVFSGMPPHLVTREQYAAARSQGGIDLRMDCADCGTWAILRYRSDYPLDVLHESVEHYAPGRHAAPFEAYVRGIRAAEEKQRTP